MIRFSKLKTAITNEFTRNYEIICSKTPAGFLPRIANNTLDMPCSLCLVILRIYVQAVPKILACSRQGNLKPEGSTCIQYGVRPVALLFLDVLVLARYRALKDKEGKIFPVKATEAYGESRSTSPRILNLDTRWR